MSIRIGALAAYLLLVSNWSLEANEPLSAHQAAASFKLPEGFQATLFAGEPDIVQPMSITFDDRGRMWVVECLSYPKWRPATAMEGLDRVVILEDTNHDGEFDQRKVFLDKGVNFTSVEYGFGGAFVLSLPRLLFIPDADGDDIPDGPGRILIDGFDLNGQHNVANSLTWGPDGWLYGCHGILANSRLGKPGTPDNERIPMNCGIWRFHPVTSEFEIVAHGTTNPWGLAFDDRGEAFLTNCVIEHAFHVVPGARFKRMFGQDFNPFAFELMQTCADHIHWAGGTWEGSRNGTGKHGEAGGGHAHSGAAIYRGTVFPDDFRNCLLTLNIHGQRLNRDRLERHKSGYVARHLADFAPSGDPWFRGVCVKQGMDGAIYFTDWSDTGECHNYDDATIHRGNGRIYKVAYTGRPTKPLALANATDGDLIEQLAEQDQNVADHARRILQERASKGRLGKEAISRLHQIVRDSASQPIGDLKPLLQTVWTLHAIGELSNVDQTALQALCRAEDTIRGWVVRMTLERKPSMALLDQLAQLSANETSAYVRMQLASGLQRLPVAGRVEIAKGLVQHAEDADDLNLTLLTWYGIEPIVALDDQQALPLAMATKIPKLRQFIARRLASHQTPHFPALLRWMEEQQDNLNVQRDILTGLHAAIEGRRDVAPDEGWTQASKRFEASSDAVIRQLSHRISLIQGSDEAFVYRAAMVKDRSLNVSEREQAIADVITTRRPAVATLLLELLDDQELRDAAIRGLAWFDREEIGEQILRRYATFSTTEKSDAISTLIGREKTALALVQAIEANKVAKQDLSEFDIRQLQRFKDARLKEMVNSLFGAKPSSADRANQIAEMKSRILAGDPSNAKAERGRTVFQKNCATCHTLFGEGRQVGPELTGAQRTDLDYVLINVMDPSALVGHSYRVTVIEMKDGRVINGIVKAENASTLTLQSATDRIVVAKQDIESIQIQPISMMPEGLLNRLSIQEIRDLVRYLASPDQVAAE